MSDLDWARKALRLMLARLVLQTMNGFAEAARLHEK
jgi:hypothetical protein